METLCLLFLSGLLSLSSQKATEDLRAWKAALEMAAVDYNQLPQIDDIQALAHFLKDQGYWEEPIIYDPWGRLYRFRIKSQSFKIWSVGADGKEGTGDDRVIRDEYPSTVGPIQLPIERKTIPSPSTPYYRSPGTTLMVTKSGDDCILSWSGTGTAYDIVRSTDPKFLNVYLLDSGNTGNSFTYAHALSNGIEAEFFDVTDETEENRGTDANGYLPPPPPQVDPPSGSFFIGNAVSLTGSNFSDVPEDNLICFNGGYCTHTSTSTTTQVDFTIPPGALSGDLTVSVGLLQSASQEVEVLLEDPSYPSLLIRSLSYALPRGDVYTAGREGSTNRVIRHYYDNGLGKWVREDRSGGYTGIHYCSPHTDRFGTLHCGYGTLSTGGGGTRQITTDPPSNMQNCINLGGAGSSTNVRGAAADPNPEGIGGRDVVYFAHYNASTGKGYIKKVASDCSSILDSDYGNRGGSWNWNAIVGLAVDPSNGDLYVAEKTQVTVVHPDETVEIFQGGFSNIYGLDAWHEPGQSFGFLLVSDAGTNAVKAVPIDNPSQAPLTLASASYLKSAVWGLTTFHPSRWQDLWRGMVLYNSGITSTKHKIPLMEPPYLIADPHLKAEVWISSPDPYDKSPYQGILRPSDPSSSIYSTVKVKAWWSDGVKRPFCVAVGDALSTAPYEPAPSPLPPGCTKPYRDPVDGITYGLCDNQEDFSATGAGSFTSSNDFYECYATDCGTKANPCIIQLRITQRYGGDNYRLYYYLPTTRWVIKSALITAWKRVFLEQDKMCRRGGILDGWLPDAGGDGNSDPDTIFLRQWGLPMDDPSIPQVGDTLTVFDADNTFESGGEEATVTARYPVDLPDPNDPNCSGIDPCSNPLCTCRSSIALDLSIDLSNTYFTSNDDFSNGKSAGVCVSSQGYFEADSSQLNKRDKTGPFDDAFVSFKAAKDGGGVVPYLPPSFFDGYELDPDQGGNCTNLITRPKPGYDFEKWDRFGEIWFKNLSKYNYVQMIGAVTPAQLDSCLVCSGTHPRPQMFGSSGYGRDGLSSRTSYVFRGGIEWPCATATQQDNATKDTTAHELGHQFYVNPTDLKGHDNHCHWVTTGVGCAPLGTCGTNTDGCTMNPGRYHWDEIIRFCYQDLVCGDPGCPNGQEGCCKGGGCSMEGNGAIRTLEDPLQGSGI